MEKRTDDQIRENVERELQWDTTVDASHVGVTVDQGVVSLVGTVPSYRKKLAAAEASHRVAGVLDVANDLEVRLQPADERDDGEIAHAVRHALEWDALLPDERIQSTVSNGWLTLTGSVDYVRERNDAEAAVERLHGVRGVTNEIRVVPPGVTAKEVREVIGDALARRARREADHVEVTVREGVVTLTGMVDSWSDKRSILGVVSHTPGVHSVQDEIRIDPFLRGSGSRIQRGSRRR